MAIPNARKHQLPLQEASNYYRFSMDDKQASSCSTLIAATVGIRVLLHKQREGRATIADRTSFALERTSHGRKLIQALTFINLNDLEPLPE